MLVGETWYPVKGKKDFPEIGTRFTIPVATIPHMEVAKKEFQVTKAPNQGGLYYKSKNTEEILRAITEGTKFVGILFYEADECEGWEPQDEIFLEWRIYSSEAKPHIGKIYLFTEGDKFVLSALEVNFLNCNPQQPKQPNTTEIFERMYIIQNGIPVKCEEISEKETVVTLDDTYNWK